MTEYFLYNTISFMKVTTTNTTLSSIYIGHFNALTPKRIEAMDILAKNPGMKDVDNVPSPVRDLNRFPAIYTVALYHPWWSLGLVTRVAGMLGATLTEQFGGLPRSDIERMVQLRTLVTKPDLRERGIARSMFEALLESWLHRQNELSSILAARDVSQDRITRLLQNPIFVMETELPFLVTTLAQTASNLRDPGQFGTSAVQKLTGESNQIILESGDPSATLRVIRGESSRHQLPDGTEIPVRGISKATYNVPFEAIRVQLLSSLTSDYDGQNPTGPDNKPVVALVNHSADIHQKLVEQIDPSLLSGGTTSSSIRIAFEL